MVMQSNKDHTEDINATILNLSRGTAVLLLALYVLYLYFQLRTHHNLFAPEPEANVEEEEEEEEVHMNPWAAAAVLIFVTILVSICADYLVASIDPLVERANISQNFIGLILIPIVGNAAEHVTAVVVAVKNKMDLAMGVAIGSSIQIALFVTPFLVVLGWIMDREMNMRFETFETVAFVLSVLVVTYTVQDGKSNYLEGAMVSLAQSAGRILLPKTNNVQLMALYIIIAVAFFVTPSDALGNEDAGSVFGSLFSPGSS